jgi:ferredoxin
VNLETPSGPRCFECGEHEYILDCAARHEVPLPSICRQGWCLTCAGLLLSGAVDQTAARAFYPADRAAGFALLCTAKPLGDLRIRTHEADAMRRHRKALGLPAPYA